MSDSAEDRFGRPLVAVTGVGLVTPLGFGVAESWAGLLAGRSGIRRITRFPTDHLKTTIAGTVDLPEDLAAGEPLPTSARAGRFAALAAEEALAASGAAVDGRFPGPLFLGMPPVEVSWPLRMELARRAGLALEPTL